MKVQRITYPFQGWWDKRIDERVYKGKWIHEIVHETDKRFSRVYYSPQVFYSAMNLILVEGIVID